MGTVGNRFDPHKTTILAELREAADLTQDQAAAYFGLQGRKRRDTIGNWERGQERPPHHRRQQFITYLWEKLNLRHRQQLIQEVWHDVMVQQWHWQPLCEEELPPELPQSAGTHLIQTTPAQLEQPDVFRSDPLLQAYTREELSDDTAYLRMINYFRTVLNEVRSLSGQSEQEQIVALFDPQWSGIACEQAIQLYEESLMLARQRDDLYLQAAALLGLANGHLEAGNPTCAIELYEQALLINRNIGDHQNASTILAKLGEAHATLGQIGRAIEYYYQALATGLATGLATDLATDRDFGDLYGGGLGLTFFITPPDTVVPV
jgi:tetratricopeptide (TPR) repeat protein